MNLSIKTKVEDMKNLINTVTVVTLLMASGSVVSAEGKQGNKCCGPPSFSSIDLNGSGFITLEEFSKQKAPRGKKRHSDKKESVFEQMDSNSDGEVSESEFTDHREVMQQRKREQHEFTTIDANNSGVITLMEFSKHNPPHGKRKGKNKTEKVFSKIDTNADGEVTELEFNEHKDNRQEQGCEK